MTTIFLVSFVHSVIPSWHGGMDLDKILYDASMGYVVAWIFWLVNIFVPSINAHRFLDRIAKRYIRDIYRGSQNAFQEMRLTKEFGDKLLFEFTTDELKALVDRMADDEVPGHVELRDDGSRIPFTWRTLIIRNCKDSRQAHEQLIPYVSQLSPTLIEVLDVVYERQESLIALMRTINDCADRTNETTVQAARRDKMSRHIHEIANYVGWIAYLQRCYAEEFKHSATDKDEVSNVLRRMDVAGSNSDTVLGGWQKTHSMR